MWKMKFIKECLNKFSDNERYQVKKKKQGPGDVSVGKVTATQT